MKLIDTHCHLNAETFQNRFDEILHKANAVGVEKCFVVGWNQSSSIDAVKLSQLNPNIFAIIGVHPVDVQSDTDLAWVKELYNQVPSRILAIGEIGLDYYWKKTPEEHQLQTEYLIRQIEIANYLKLPIVIHCRDAYEDILVILKKHKVLRGGVMHCYAGPSQLVEAFVSLGFYLSFGGPITFKKAEDSRKSVLLTPLDRLLIETDSPYLSPDPYRGKENTPENLPIVFKKVVEIKQISEEKLAKTLIDNVTNMFHVKTS
jgi:TatD DNase family protein